MRRLEALRKNWASLPKALKYGLVTNTAFSVVLRVSADATQQNIEKKKIIKFDEYNLKRTMNIAGIGAILGPFVHYWYKVLDSALPGKTFPIICKKIVMDQVVGGVAFTFIFIIGLCLMEGQHFKSALSEFLEKFPVIYLVDWLVWPPVQYLNFYLVPPQFRVLFVNVALFCWNVFLSFIKYCYHTIP